MFERSSILLVALAALVSSRPAHAEPVSLVLDPDQVVNRIDEKIYGQFLEHIYHSVNGGLWGELVWNRSFEEWSDQEKKQKGTPELPHSATVARHWSFYGKGRGFREMDKPLNSNTSQGITSTGAEAGVAQKPFCIRKGETYSGSLWARGTATEGLVVRLANGVVPLEEVRLNSPSDQWQEYTFQFRPQTTVEDATLQIGIRGAGTIELDQVSLMSQAARDTGGFRPDLLQAVAALKPPVIRWPGGSFAEKYRWKDGIGPQSQRRTFPVMAWDDMDVNSFGTDEFLAMCRRLGVAPLLVINIGGHAPAADRAEYLQDAVDWLEYCNGSETSKWGKLRAANGHPEPYGVKLWEIDNEVWFRMHPTAYADMVRQFMTAMKKIDPTIKIIACGSGGLAPVTSGNPKYGLAWNREVLEGCADVIDYLSIHHYEDPKRFAEGPEVLAQFIRETGKLIANSKNPNIKLFDSEWNAQCTDWRTGLYAGGVLNNFERCGDLVEIASPALFLRHVSAKAWDNALINFDQSTWFPAPNYVVMKLWRDHYAPNRIAVNGEAGPLNGVATKSADGKTLYFKVVNPKDQPVPVELRVGDGFTVGTASLEVVAPGSLDARNRLDQPDAVKVQAATTALEGQRVRFTLPAYSAAVATIGRR